jgi:hypothetical protein
MELRKQSLQNQNQVMLLVQHTKDDPYSTAAVSH